MGNRFAAHNAHLDDPEAIAVLDPHLRLLARQPLIHLPALLDRLPVGKPGICSIAEGRRIGKTTLLEQWMERPASAWPHACDSPGSAAERVEDNATAFTGVG